MSEAIFSIDPAGSTGGDHTAYVLLTERPGGGVHVAAAYRLEAQMPTVRQVDELVKRVDMIMAKSSDLSRLTVLIEANSLGQTLHQLLGSALVGRPKIHVCGLTVTTGDSITGSPRGAVLHIGKQRLKGAALRMMANAARDVEPALTFGRLKPLGSIPRELGEELLNLQVLSEGPSGIKWGAPNDRGSHDDLALACISGCAAAELLWANGTATRVVTPRQAAEHLSPLAQIKRTIAIVEHHAEREPEPEPDPVLPQQPGDVIWEPSKALPGYAVRRDMDADRKVTEVIVPIVTEETDKLSRNRWRRLRDGEDDHHSLWPDTMTRSPFEL